MPAAAYVSFEPVPLRPASPAFMPLAVRRALVGVLVFLLQWLVLGRLRIFGAYPDAVLLYVAWMGLRTGRRGGALTGFGLGLLMDAVYGTWGIYMFVKTLIGFLMGQFPTDTRESIRLSLYQVFTGSLVVALVHNGLFVILLALQEGTRSSFMITALWLGSALYTACAATVAALFRNP